LLVKFLRRLAGTQNARAFSDYFFMRPSKQIRKRLIGFDDIAIQVGEQNGIGGMLKRAIKPI
jgi:hypothetical protein